MAAVRFFLSLDLSTMMANAPSPSARPIKLFSFVPACAGRLVSDVNRIALAAIIVVMGLRFIVVSFG